MPGTGTGKRGRSAMRTATTKTKSKMPHKTGLRAIGRVRFQKRCDARSLKRRKMNCSAKRTPAAAKNK